MVSRVRLTDAVIHVRRRGLKSDLTADKVNVTVSGDWDIALGSIIIPVHINCCASSADTATLMKPKISDASMPVRNIEALRYLVPDGWKTESKIESDNSGRVYELKSRVVAIKSPQKVNGVVTGGGRGWRGTGARATGALVVGAPPTSSGASTVCRLQQPSAGHRSAGCRRTRHRPAR
jgi:hypothetical protein